MKEIRYTLVCDGTTDHALLPILNWLLQQHLPDCAIQARWLDVRQIGPRRSLADRIRSGLQLFPCELLFVHRDAEREPPENRVMEIESAISMLQECEGMPYVCVVPIRMTEAWLLFDEQALREAFGNANGKEPLEPLDFRRVEEKPDPKETLKERLRKASGLKGRRLKQFDVNYAAQRVADLIEDFAPLRALSAFVQLESELRTTIQTQGWQDNSATEEKHDT